MVRVIVKQLVALCSIVMVLGCSGSGGGSPGSSNPPSTTTPYSNTTSAQFDGVNGYGSAGNVQTIFSGVTTALSYSFWIKMNSAPASFDGIWGATTDGSGWSDLFGCFWMNTLQIRCKINGTAQITTTVLTHTQWNHVVYTYDGNGELNKEIKIFINGTLNVERAYTTALAAPNANMELGRIIGDLGTENDFNIDGNLDELAVWSSALSASEVTDIYNGGTPIDLSADSGNYASSSNLLGYWRLGDGSSGSTDSDLVGSSDLTLSGGSSFQVDAP